MTASVRTVLGDVSPADLGITYIHEHLIIDSPLIVDRWPHILLTSVEDAVQELEPCSAAGVGTIVDAMPAAAGRDAIRLAEISRLSGVHVVACTGLHTSKYYEGHPWTSEEPSEILADLFIADVLEGIDRYDYTGPLVRRTPHRAGILKVGVLEDLPTARDFRVFEAAARTHEATGVPILTHCEGGRGAMAQIELFDRLGVSPDRVVVSHTDKVNDLSYHRDLLATGVYLEYDQASRQGEGSVEHTARIVAAMVTDGHADRLMLSSDAARRSMWAIHGGLGMAWLATRFVEILGTLGVGADAIETMLRTNPARFLAFEAPVATKEVFASTM
jgi:phosphotriesterase-related protein